MKQSVLKYKKILFFTLLSLLTLFSVVTVSCSSDKQEKTESETHQHADEQGQLWTCGMHPEVILDEPGQCPKCGMDLVPLKTNQASAGTKNNLPAGERKILYWQAPMDPTEIYEKPGKSKMGMDLVPVYDDQVSSGSSVQIDPVTVQNMGVRTAPVERTNFTRSLRALGKVDYNEQTIYAVSARISGWIEHLSVNYTGQEVRKGQTLLEIYSPDLVTTQQEYLLALKNQQMIGDSKFTAIREGAASLVKASRQRLRYWDIPESEIKNLENSGKVSKTLKLVSPANGIVIHKNAVEGMHIKEGMDLYRIADLSTVWVNVSIYDNEALWIKEGQPAELELSYTPGKIIKGKIAYIYPYLNEKTRDLKVRIEFPNPDLQLKPGMFGNVDIKIPAIKDALIVPTEAVIRSGQRNLVFVDKGDGRFEPREVRIGEESDGKIRIISGLLGNETVVVSAQFMLDSESRLQEAIQKMLAEKSGTKKTEPTMDMPDNSEAEIKMDSEPKMEMDSKPKDKLNKSKETEMKCGAGKCGGN